MAKGTVAFQCISLDIREINVCLRGPCRCLDPKLEMGVFGRGEDDRYMVVSRRRKGVHSPNHHLRPCCGNTEDERKTKNFSFEALLEVIVS